MASDEERLSYSQWVLEQNLHWISAAEVKAGAIVAINTAMLGALTSAFSALPIGQHTEWANLWSFVATACLLSSVFCIAMSVLPRTDGPPYSFVFFGKIVKRTAADYIDAFSRAQTSEFLNDCLDQVYRNAEIACTKFKWVRSAMAWSFASLIPWIAALACLMKV